MTAAIRMLALAALALPPAGCADLEIHDEGECGNNVVEPEEGEDCDIVVDASLGEDLQCGVPDGGPQQCRYVCDGADCPRGWTCADDGICRAPSGEFEVEGDPVLIAAAQQIALSDLFGEAEAELVLRLEDDIVAYAAEEADAGPRLELSIPNARGDLSFVDVDGDDHADVLVPAASVALDPTAQPRVHALRSQAERWMTAVVPQRLARAPIAALASVGVGEGAAEVLVQVQRDPDAGLVALVEPSNCTEAPSDARLVLGGSADAEVPPPAVGRGSPDGIGHIAVATVGSAKVRLVAVERSCGPNVCIPVSSVGEPCATGLTVTQTLQMPAPVAAPGCSFFDADRSGGPDLVCHLQGDRFGIAVEDGGSLDAPQDGTAVFSDLASLPAGQARGCAPVQRILVAADLDGDGLDDVVTPHGVFVADPTGGFARAYARILGDGWGEAVAGDFDGDGRLELVANVEELDQDCAATRLQVLVETDGAYAAQIVRDAARPTDLRRGDFDGDGLDDVAAVEAGVDEVRVIVAYGESHDALGDVVSVGGFAQVSALAAVRSREGTEINDDLLSDLAIASEDGEFSTLVTGTTTRSLLSPLSPVATPSTAGTRPLVVLGGRLVPRPRDGQPGPPDVLALRDEGGWLYRDDDVHHGDDPLALEPPALRVACSTWSLAAPRPGMGSLIAGIDGHPTRIGAAPDGCDLDAPPTLVVARFAGTRDAPQLLASTIPVVDAARRPQAVLVFDFDGSGDEDVIVSFSHAGGERRGSLAWLQDPQPGTAVPSLQPLLPELEVWAVTAIDADRDEAPELAVLAPDGLHIVDHDAERDPAVVVRDPVFAAPRAPGPDDPVTLVAGDIDGDELFDLALLVADSIYLYPAIESE